MTYRGTVKNGVVVLPPEAHLADGIEVRIETTNGLIDLRAHGIDARQAAELRAQVGVLAEDWDSPEMDLYDNYDAAKANL